MQSLPVSRDELLALLRCPACRAMIQRAEVGLRCSSCGRQYAVADGIPRLVTEDAARDKLKADQASWFDAEVDAEWEVERPHGAPRFYEWLLREKFRRSVTAFPSLRGMTALTVCGGSGMDAEFLAEAGARVIASDISPGAAARVVERARRRGLQITPIVADAEALPFGDRSIDLVYVHDGLHHLGKPLAALAEMARVAGYGIAITEPARAAATAVAARFGLAEVREESGNDVGRVVPDELVRELCSHGFEIARSERYAMLYRHVPGRASAGLSSRPVFPVARSSLLVANRLLGRIGNKATVQALRTVGR